MRVVVGTATARVEQFAREGRRRARRVDNRHAVGKCRGDRRSQQRKMRAAEDDAVQAIAPRRRVDPDSDRRWTPAIGPSCQPSSASETSSSQASSCTLAAGSSSRMARRYAPSRTVASVARTRCRPPGRAATAALAPGSTTPITGNGCNLRAQCVERHRRRRIACDDQQLDVTLLQLLRLPGRRSARSRSGSWCRKAGAPYRRGKPGLRAAMLA